MFAVPPRRCSAGSAVQLHRANPAAGSGRVAEMLCRRQSDAAGCLDAGRLSAADQRQVRFFQIRQKRTEYYGNDSRGTLMVFMEYFHQDRSSEYSAFWIAVNFFCSSASLMVYSDFEYSFRAGLYFSPSSVSYSQFSYRPVEFFVRIRWPTLENL